MPIKFNNIKIFKLNYSKNHLIEILKNLVKYKINDIYHIYCFKIKKVIIFEVYYLLIIKYIKNIYF